MSLSSEKQAVLLKAAQQLRQFTLESLIAATGLFPPAVREELQALVKAGKVHHLSKQPATEPVYYAPPAAQPKEKPLRVPATPDGLWMLMRRLKGFTVRQLQNGTSMKPEDIRSVLLPLVKGGYVEALGRGRNKRMYRLLKGGNRRPVLKRDGQPRQPNGHDRMWMAMKVLKSFDIRDLSLAARVSRYTSSRYCKALATAGYLQTPPKSRGHYRFVRSRDTGPKSPQLQDGRLVDRNTGRVVWPESEAA